MWFKIRFIKFLQCAEPTILKLRGINSTAETNKKTPPKRGSVLNVIKVNVGKTSVV